MEAIAPGRAIAYRKSQKRKGPVAQLDRALPSEGRGQRFESSRDRHFFKQDEICVRGSEPLIFKSEPDLWLPYRFTRSYSDFD